MQDLLVHNDSTKCCALLLCLVSDDNYATASDTYLSDDEQGFVTLWQQYCSVQCGLNTNIQKYTYLSDDEKDNPSLGFGLAK